ncbi:GvpL/GvpF family gas vesicle protein [Kribbella sp. NPDC004875]|uniref:GvpL/GvpF family gas vesicle protein n=1 Tax=Kribbella sp. NPDC004875 TaxID=3364107 RepID=UPI003697E55C
MPETEPETGPETGTETGTYVYAVGVHLDEQSVDGLTGVDEPAVRLISWRGLQVVVSSVDLAEFGEAALRRNLENLDWVERTARRHDEVVRRAAANTTALAPFRLITIYRSDDAVRDRIDELYEKLVDALDRLDRRSEWSVKAFGREQSAKPAPAAADTPESGAAYLERRRAEIRGREETAEAQRMRGDQLFWDLAPATAATRRLMIQDRRLTDRPEPMLLNASFLVDDDRSSEFFQVVDRLRDIYPSLCIEVDGPWPPYSFAVLDDG